ncbi:MAG: dTDP-4-dehydrorhamnose reductase [Treponema sp.]|jgi:dTDP-4-dehydrorhamnose reductase|nr:dTDP-4-dehydrorhamnose reductase [Treponema sp.]
MIWLIGAQGMLGTELARLFETHRMEYLGTDREVDITDGETLTGFTKNQPKRISWIVNCAAYTAVDRAEDEALICSRINRDGAANIARAARGIGAKVVHISTDYVFDGTSRRPYQEDDAPCPIGVYGRTKYEGEQAIQRIHKAAYIIRTSWLYGAYGKNFVTTMLRLMEERERLAVVNDQRGSPTWAHDLAGLMLRLITSVEDGQAVPAGIYHVSNEGNISWFDLATEIYREARERGLVTHDCTVYPCTSAEFPAKVTRPAYSVLDKSKIKAALGIEIPDWKFSLRAFLETLCRNRPQ